MALERFEYVSPVTGAASVIKLTAEEGERLKLSRVGGEKAKPAPANKAANTPGNKAAKPVVVKTASDDATDPGASL